MTKKLFQENAYIKECKSTIVDIINNEIVLDQSIFAPEAGGQTCDLGLIDDSPVISVAERNGILFHRIDTISKQFKIGKTVQCSLDWEKRFDHMQNHCGEHVLSGILFREYRAQNKGFHLAAEYSTLDVDIKNMSSEIVNNLEKLANDIVFSGLPVQTVLIESREEALKLSLRKELKVDEDISIVTIPGVDCVACCCPHPKSTAEIGIIKIIRSENYKGMTRIYFKCGKRALADYQKKHNIIVALNEKYSADETTLLENIKIQDSKNNQLRRDLQSMKSLFADIETASLLSEATSYVYHEYDNQTLDDLRAISKKLMEKSDLPIILTSTSAMCVLLSHSGKSKIKCGQLVKDFACGFGGKGGGSDTLAQALFSDVDIMRNFVKIASVGL